MYNFKDNDFYSKSEILLKLKYGKKKERKVIILRNKIKILFIGLIAIHIVHFSRLRIICNRNTYKTLQR